MDITYIKIWPVSPSKIIGIDVELQIFLTWSAISENEIKPVSGIPSLVDETLKPDIKPISKPSFSINFAERESKHPGITMISFLFNTV